MTVLSASGRLRVVIVLLGLAAMLPAPSRAQMAGIRAGVAKVIVTAPASKTGAGIVVRRDADEAYIVTAAHVASGADKIVVQFSGVARSWPAEVRNIEAENLAQGLALLRVAGPLPAELRALPLATEFTAAGGEQVNMIVHQPSTSDWGVLAGIVSGRKGREVVIQAPIQEQASGGPVVLGGRVVGLVQRKDPSGAFGYAVTALAIREYVQGNNLSLELPRASPQKPEAKAALDANEPDGIDWAWPASGRVLANFSDANKGIDVAGKVGEPVYASAAGRVVYSGAGLRGYGNLIIVKHNDSYLSAYAHNSKPFVKEGQSVSKGQKIAEVGSSDTDQPKLHFEIRHLGKPVDPARYLPSR